MTSTFSRIDVHLITTMRSLVEGNPFNKFLPRCATTDRCFVATTAQFITQARNLETTQSKQQLSHQAKPRHRAFCKVAVAAAGDSSLVQHKNQNISFTSVLSLFRVLFRGRHTTRLTVRRSGYEVYHRRTTTMHRTSPFLQSALRTSTHADASTTPPSSTSDHGWAASHSFS